MPPLDLVDCIVLTHRQSKSAHTQQFSSICIEARSWSQGSSIEQSHNIDRYCNNPEQRNNSVTAVSVS
jgi:hypothetical protein